MKWLWIALLTVAVMVGFVACVGLLLPRNHTVTRSSHFEAPPEAVWKVIAGPPTWRPDVQRFENLPPLNGHRAWKEVDRHGNGVIYEVVEETPPFQLITRIADPSLPYGGIWIHQITPEPGGCTLQITENGEVYNPFFRFMSRFVFGYTATVDGFFKALHAKLGDGGS